MKKYQCPNLHMLHVLITYLQDLEEALARYKPMLVT
jgi:hypothetical protein